MPRKPTLKQRRTVKILAENGGMSVSRAMKMAGYSEQTAVTPSKLTDSNGFAELMAEHLPDWDLIDIHKKGLHATKHVGLMALEVADHQTRHKFLETAYRLKGRLNNENQNLGGDISISLALYEQNDRHTLPVQAKGLSITVPVSNGRRVQESGDSVAQKKREGQDSPPGGD